MSLERLLAGNERFLRTMDHELMEELSRGQAPYACVLTCSDSRVSPEHIFQGDLGDLFVIRTAGNLAMDPTVLATIEYSVEHLGVPVVMVLGHTDCGAVKAAIDGTAGGQCAHLVSRIREMGMDGTEEALIKRNVIRQVDHILAESPAIRCRKEAGETSVVGAVFHIFSGMVELL